MTSKAFSIYFLLKTKNELANLRLIKKKKILDEEAVWNLNMITF